MTSVLYLLTKGAEGRNKHRGSRQTHLSFDSAGIQKPKVSLPGLQSSAEPFPSGAAGETRFSSVQLPEAPSSSLQARSTASSKFFLAVALLLSLCRLPAPQAFSRDPGLYLESYKDVRILVMMDPPG